MNVKQLKAILEKMDDDCLVVTPSFDHSYLEAEAYDATAGYDEKDHTFSEWWGPEHAIPGEKPRRVLVVG